MVRRLFEDFLDSPSAYRAAERFWEKLVGDLAEEMGQGGEWHRWIPLHYADGTSFDLDGNPIYDARSDILQRAIRIMQYAAVGEDLELGAWVADYGEDIYPHPEFPLSELFIALSVSEESAQLARELMRKWMTPATSVDEMRSFIRRMALQPEAQAE